MKSCLTRVIADGTSHIFQKVDRIPIDTEFFSFTSYETRCDELREEFTAELKKFWDEQKVLYSEHDLMAVRTILGELVTNAVSSSLEKFKQLKQSEEPLDLKNPKVEVCLRIYDKTAVEIRVADWGQGLPKNLEEVPLEPFKNVCNYISGAFGLDMIKKLSQILLISYRHKLGFRTNEFNPQKIDGSIIVAWRFVLNQ